ncbi:asparagine synthase-related protein [Mesorhizobium yinganensis]|uniref:asparagine synthase-related protein n=1 Tax=Mesorhizobium yinganensis TaxID=3157707 RepID=UPI0032B7E170
MRANKTSWLEKIGLLRGRREEEIAPAQAPKTESETPAVAAPVEHPAVEPSMDSEPTAVVPPPLPADAAAESGPQLDLRLHPVEAMEVVQDARSPNDAGEILIYGEPIHAELKKVIQSYVSDSLETFLAHQARHGVGSYCVVDTSKPGRCRIVTSTGYCGGYIRQTDSQVLAGTTLISVLAGADSKIEMDPYGLCLSLSHAPKGSYQQLPFSTPFRDVRRLPPASVVEFENGKLTTCYSYLTTAALLPPPASFEAAMEELSESLARHYARTKKKPALMLSGGVDSLVIYLSLREKMDPKDIRVFTIETSREHSLANGEYRAFPISQNIGFNVKYIAHDSLSSTSVNDEIKRMMENDIISSKGPHLAFIDNRMGRSDIIHGQNMDAMFNVNMLLLQGNLEKGYLSKGKMNSLKKAEEEKQQYQSFIGNLQFSDVYLNDPAFQRDTIEFFAKLHKRMMSDTEPGGAGIVRGMISSQYPNLLVRPNYPVNQLSQTEYLDREVDLFHDHVGDVSPRLAVDLVRYHTYSHLSNKRISTMPLPDGSRTLFVAMSGPIVSYLLGKSRGLSVVGRPKNEVYDLAEKLAGKPYSKLMSTSKEYRSPGANVDIDDEEEDDDAIADDMLLKDSMDLINPKTSRVLAAISEMDVRGHVSSVYHETVASCRPGDSGFTRFSQSRARYLLNLELLLRQAAS